MQEGIAAVSVGTAMEISQQTEAEGWNDVEKGSSKQCHEAKIGRYDQKNHYEPIKPAKLSDQSRDTA